MEELFTNQLMELYIGASITHASERKFLNQLDEYSKRKNLPCMVFANFEFKERQFDFVVVTQSSVHVVDAKSTSLPVRGEINGDWQHLQLDGQWRYYKNGYVQVLECKNKLRNSMRDVPDQFFPDGHVVFVDGLPEGSKITNGDFKVKVSDIYGFFKSIENKKSNPWSMDKWRNFAIKLNLKKSSLQEALDNKATRLLQMYRENFIDDYECEARAWLAEDNSQIQNILTTFKHGTGCFISGPSGCGKTLLAKYLGVELSKSGLIVIFLSAKDFDGSLSDLLRKEISLIIDSYYSGLMRSLSIADANICFIIDGLNEISEEATKKFLRGIKTLARRYSAKILVTSQSSLPVQLAGLERFEVSAPTYELKKRIAKSTSSMISAAAIQVLSSVHSGLEARIVGEMQAKIGLNTTRLNLLDQYIRHRLGENARRGSSALRHFATILVEKVAFSTSESDFDIRMMLNGFTDDDCDALFDSGILVQRGGRVSFIHEMHYYACASHGYAFEAYNNPQSIGKMLNNPVYSPLANDVISAIEDEQTCLYVLENITNANLIANAADGNLGQVAKRAVTIIIRNASSRVISEIKSAELEIKGVEKLSWSSSTRTNFPPEEVAQYQAIGIRAGRGNGIEEYLALCRTMDKRLEEERLRHQEQARSARIALKSKSFQLAYLGFGSKISFTLVAEGASKNFIHKREKNFLSSLSLNTLSSGELYFILEYAWLWSYTDEMWFSEELIEVIENRFCYEPYHVKLSILDNAGLNKNQSLETTARMINAIESLDANSFGVGVSSCIIEALGRLGALEESAEASREAIRNQIKEVVGESEDNNVFESALTVYVSMFDHPFDWIFYEEIHELTIALLHKLYVRALQAPSIKQSMSQASLVANIIEYNKLTDIYLLSRFAETPSDQSLMPQDAIAAFVLAIRFLAYHDCPLPAFEVKNDRDHCFNAFRKIIYAMQSQTDETRNNALSGWRFLEECPISLSIICLHEVHDALKNSSNYYYPDYELFTPIDLIKAYPGEILYLVRRLIRSGEAVKTAHGFVDNNATNFAFNIVGKLGDRGDLGILRELSRSSNLASEALNAIKSIEKIPMENSGS